MNKRPLPQIRVLGLLVALALAALAALAAPASAKSGSLTTLFDANNGQAGASFDLEVLHPGGVVVESLDVNVDNGGLDGIIEVWTHQGTAAGFEDSLDGWTSQGSVEVTSEGFDNPTPVPISFSLPQGSYGVAVGATDGSSFVTVYTDGNQTFENNVLKFTSGRGLESPLLDSDSIPNRIWNGTIHYSTPSLECRDLKADRKKAKRKYKKAQKKAKKKKRQYKKAKASGSQSKAKKKKRQYKKAKKKAKKKKRSFKKAKRAYRNDCK